jgi:toxin ParE1/3/4
MVVRWTPDASADLEQIADYISEDSLISATRVVQTIVDAIESLTLHPFRGRPGRLEDTRELIMPKLPYLIVYRIRDNQVVILNVVHAARRWPPRK